MTDWQPAFEGQRPPFAPANLAAVRHGANSPRTVEPAAGELADRLLADESTPRYLVSDPSYRPAIAAWARSEVQVALLAQWLADQPLEAQLKPPRGGAVPPLEVLRRWEATAATHRARLGLDPLSRSRLARDVVAAQTSVDALEAIRAAGRATAERRALPADDRPVEGT